MMVARTPLMVVIALAVTTLVSGCCMQGPSMRVTPSDAELPANTTATFTASVTCLDNTSVTWTATCGTISGTGNTITYTAPAAAGTCTVAATSVAQPNLSASAIVTVTAPPETVAITIAPMTATLTVNDTHAFTATVTGATDTSVTWTATCGTISGTGNTITYTAPDTADPDTCTVTASSVADPGTSASAVVTITQTTPDSATFTHVSVGTSYSLALDDDGVAWAWGTNTHGKLGDGTTNTRYEPVRVQMPSGVRFTAIVAGHDHSLALDRAGKAWAWGSNSHGQLGDDGGLDQNVPVQVTMPPVDRFVAINVGEYHSIALDSAGNAWAWGRNAHGQLGTGDTNNRSMAVSVTMPADVTFDSITAGWRQSLALDTAGNAWAWGSNWGGQLGDGTKADRSSPVAVQMPAGIRFTSLDSGNYHALALDQHGKAWAWGHNRHGRLGDSSEADRSEPVQVIVPDGTTFTSVSAIGLHSMALDQDGDAWAWGRNGWGRLGVGEDDDINRLEPTQVIMPDGIRFVVLGSSGMGAAHSSALDQHGHAWAWGPGSTGALGHGGTATYWTPGQVSMPTP